MVYYESHINVCTKKWQINNSTLNVGYVIRNEYGVTIPEIDINIKDSNIRSYCFYKQPGYIHLLAKDSNINKIGDDTTASNSTIATLVNCYLGGDGYRSYITMKGGRIGGGYPNARLELFGVEGTIGSDFDGIARMCSLTTLPKATSKQIEIFSSTENDKPVPYMRINSYYRVGVSNVYRVNGSNGSLYVETDKKVSSLTVDRIKVTQPAGKKKIKFYVASQNETAFLFDYQLIFNYVIDGTGYNYMSEISTPKLSDQEWSGMYEGYKSFELEFELPKHGTDVELEISISMSTREPLVNILPIYIDLKPTWN
jgi:hypothetical protein